jgi:type I site-specific restriction-modification system R (restriction) subunit
MDKQVVFIFDECHRSQFGEAQANLQKKFKRFYQFGFTGTPIFPAERQRCRNHCKRVWPRAALLRHHGCYPR